MLLVLIIILVMLAMSMLVVFGPRVQVSGMRAGGGGEERVRSRRNAIAGRSTRVSPAAVGP